MDAHIAVCITTRNRYEVFKKTLFMHGKFRPDNSSLFVVDDASDKPIRIGGNFFRFDENVGVATAKNKCLELADKWGADHIFLFDSDCHPISPDWHLPYINSGQKHLMYNFRLPNKPKTDMQEIHRDDKITAWTHTRGALLYIHRSVLDVVGGFDERYIFDFYHPDFSNRVYNAGLTKFRSMDVPDSDKLLYCYDQDASIMSSVDDKTRRLNRSKDYARYKAQRQSKEYMRYK